MGDFNYPRLADFGAAISGANKLLCQKVLEELDVRVLLEATFSLLNVFIFHVASFTYRHFIVTLHAVLLRFVVHN